MIKNFSQLNFLEVFPKGFAGKLKWAYIGFQLNENKFVINFKLFGQKNAYRTVSVCLNSRPDNSAKDNSADLKFSQKYAENSAKDNSTNNSDHRSRANVLRACQQSVGLYTKFRAGYLKPATLNRVITPIPTFFVRI